MTARSSFVGWMVAAGLSVPGALGMVSSWTLKKVDWTGPTAALEECRKACGLEGKTLTTLHAWNDAAMTCVNTKAVREGKCVLKLSVAAESRTDSDAVVCAGISGVSFSETVLADCGFDITEVAWNNVLMAPSTLNDATFTREVDALSAPFKTVADPTSLCSADWTTTSPALKATLTGTKQKTGKAYDVVLTPKTALDPELQWFIPATADGLAVTSVEKNNGVEVTTYTVTRTFEADARNLCKSAAAKPIAAAALAALFLWAAV